MTDHITSRLSILLLSGMLGLAGCGGSAGDLPELASVTGIVIQNGQPVHGAEVNFRPLGKEAQGLASAVTDESGHFELRYSAEQLGAVVGENQIVLTVYGERGPSEVEGELGPPLKPPREFDLGQKTVPTDGLDEMKLEVPSRT